MTTHRQPRVTGNSRIGTIFNSKDEAVAELSRRYFKLRKHGDWLSRDGIHVASVEPMLAGHPFVVVRISKIK